MHVLHLSSKSALYLQFAPIFNHHDRLEQINKGERFPYVANILDLVIMPKVSLITCTPLYSCIYKCAHYFVCHNYQYNVMLCFQLSVFGMPTCIYNYT